MIRTGEPTSIEQHRSGVVCVVVDPAMHGTGKIVRAAFGRHGVRHLGLMTEAMPGSWIAMVGWVQREPARVLACKPCAAEFAIDAAFEMARHLARNSAWLVRLPAEHQAAVLALLAERTETVGVMQ